MTIIKPLVTWILCTDREDSLLHRAIKSCLYQTVSNFELILVVNGQQSERIHSVLTDAYLFDPRIRVVATPTYMLNFSLSLGLHLARAPYVARMDSDDVSHPERLEKQLSYMQNNEDVAVLGSSYHLIDATGSVQSTMNSLQEDQEIRKALVLHNPICHPSVMLRREAILEVGGYLGGRNAEDYDLWLRLLLHRRWRFASLPEPLLSYNASPTGAARKSRDAYANVAGAQFRQFLLTKNPTWLLGATISSVKVFFRAKRG